MNVYLPRDYDEIELDAMKSREQYNRLEKKDRHGHPIAIILRAKKNRIRNKMTAPFHFIAMLKKRNKEKKSKLQHQRSISIDSENSILDFDPNDLNLNLNSNS